jgi:hypothetical protein
MSDYTQTPNLGLYKPTYDADAEQWGHHLNSNADILDNAVGTGGGGGDFLPLSGGTLTGALTITSGNLALTGALGSVQVPNGLLASPSLQVGGTDMGFYRTGSNLNIAAPGGTNIWTWAPGITISRQQLDMQSQTITGLADPTAATDALNLRTGDARYLAAGSGPFLPIAGGTLTGPLNVTPTGAPAARAVQAWFADRVNVRDYYTGTSWQAAFNAAFAALPAGTGGTIEVPAGTYLLGAALVWADKPVSLVGDGMGITQIQFQHQGVGITINQTATNSGYFRINISDITFIAGGLTNQTQGAIAINYATGANFPQSWAEDQVSIENIEMISRSNGGSNTFFSGLTLTGVWQPMLRNIRFIGPITSPPQAGTYGIGLAQCEDTRIVQAFLIYADAAVLVLDHLEGINIVSATVLGANWTVSYDPGATNWPAPEDYVMCQQIQITHCELVCILGCINLRDTLNIVLHHNHIQRFPFGSAGWTAYVLQDCQWCDFHHNNLASNGPPSQSICAFLVSYTANPLWGCSSNTFNDYVNVSTMTPEIVYNPATLASTNSFSWTQNDSVRHETFNNNSMLLIKDTSGVSGFGLTVQNDNNAVLYGSDASGGFRPLLSATMRDSTSAVVFDTDVSVGGNLRIGTATEATVLLNGPVTSNRLIYLMTSGDIRWSFGANVAAESGANAGSDFTFIAWNDAGTAPISVPLAISRATGAVTLSGALGVNGSAPPAKPTVTGSRAANAALASLLTALASYGLVTDSTTA